MEPYPVIALSNSQRLTASTFQNSSTDARPAAIHRRWLAHAVLRKATERVAVLIRASMVHFGPGACRGYMVAVAEAHAPAALTTAVTNR